MTFEELVLLLKSNIEQSKVHQDYTHVTNLANEYLNIFTGTGIASYLRNYRKNENDAAFNQMLTIYETTIPATVHNLDTIFTKPLRSNRINFSIEHSENEARNEIIDTVAKFWQGEADSGLDAYLRERWKHLCIYDPNAFIAIEFRDFNPTVEKPEPFPVEYSSKEVLNFDYNEKGVLQYVICEKEHYYIRKVGEKDTLVKGSRFILYEGETALTFTEIDKEQRITDIVEGEIIEIFKGENNSKFPDRVFVAQIFELKSVILPVFRVGFELDPVTNKRTCLSMIHYALPFFKKELKSGVELDLTIKAHVFPQKYAYGVQCTGDVEAGVKCIDGKTPNGAVCSRCNGTNVVQPIHTTSQEVIWIPLPKAGQDALDLTKAMAYFSPPVELVRFMEEYTDRLTEKAKSAVFPSQAIASSRNKLSGEGGQPTTATEQDYSWDNVYDALKPFTDKYSFAWRFIAKMCSIYTDNFNESLQLYHKFPTDLKMKPVSALMIEAKQADESGLPSHIKQAIHNDIANIYYADSQSELSKIIIKNKFHPFSGKSETEVQALIMNNEVLPYYRILYIYFDVIFEEIDSEMGDAFYLFSYEKQKAELKRRVDLLIEAVNQQKAQSIQDAQTALRQLGAQPIEDDE